MIKIYSSLIFMLVFVTVSASEPYHNGKCIIKSEFIYNPEDVPFPSCHASTITETGKGLLAAWFGGTAENRPDVGIWLSRFENGSWSKPIEVVNGVQHKSKRYPCWNPVLFNTGKQILLFYKVGPSPSTWWGEMMTSDDNGFTWSRPSRLPEDIFGPIKDKPVLLNNGILLCPSSTENDGWRLHIEMTADNGLTWERTAPLNGKETGAIQPTILFNRDGSLRLLCRSRNSAILTATSVDNGYTWTALEPLQLPNPNSGIDAVTLKDGRHLLVYNHLLKGRNILNVAVSDDGQNWKAAVILENDLPGKEYSYPAVIQSADGMVHITYTWNRKLIKHVVIDPSAIATKDIINGIWPEK
ncbi:MAG TPA: sialidase family protein [Bacteroidales bacterium]|nr:sialidase family protein [Bacteroidales bacterium]